MTASIMNQELLDLYRELRSRAMLLPSSLAKKLGCPFLIFPRSKWYESIRRLLIVGQEPHDWRFPTKDLYDAHWLHPELWCLKDFIDYKHSVRALTCAYLTSTYEIKSTDRPSPFTRAFNDCMVRLNRDGGTGDVIGKNLIRCAYYVESRPGVWTRSLLNATPEERRQILDWQRGCLSEEIAILNPTSVLFLTGPNYDEILRDEFPHARFEQVAGRDLGQFARIIDDNLPYASFRTYHPGYLARSRKWLWLTELDDEIIRADWL
jgi:hypothetical protein